MKALEWLSGSLLAVLASFVCLVAAKAEIPVVLLSVPLSGPAATYGVELQQATEFFFQQESVEARLVVIDDRCDPKEGVTALRHALMKYPVAAVIGAPCSGVVLAIAPLILEHKLPLVSLGAMASAISDLQGEIYRVGIRDSEIANALAKPLESKTVQAIVEQTEFAESVAERLKTIVPHSFNLPAVSFTANDEKVVPHILRARQTTADLFFVSTQSAITLSQVVKSLARFAELRPIFTGVFGESPILKELAPHRPMEIYYAGTPTRKSCGESDKVVALFEKFEARYAPLKSNDFTLIAAQIGTQLLQALLANNTVKEVPINGICGTVTFDQKGDMQGLGLRLLRLERSLNSPEL